MQRLNAGAETAAPIAKATGNRVRIDVDEDADGTGDRRATLILRAGPAGQLQPGEAHRRVAGRGDQVQVIRHDDGSMPSRSKAAICSLIATPTSPSYSPVFRLCVVSVRK